MSDNFKIFKIERGITMIIEYRLYKNDELEILSYELQNIIDFLADDSVIINDIEDLFNNDIMQDYTLAIKEVSNADCR